VTLRVVVGHTATVTPPRAILFCRMYKPDYLFVLYNISVSVIHAIQWARYAIVQLGHQLAFATIHMQAPSIGEVETRPKLRVYPT